MRTIVILHGIQGFAGWQNDVSAKLISKGYKVIMPVFPNWGHPDRKECLKIVQKEVTNVNLSELTLIGHSLGVTTACDFLETLKSPIACFISVSGFATDYKAELNSYFLKEKTVDYNKIIQNSKKRIVIYGENDLYVPQKTLADFATDIKATDTIVIEKGGHLSTGAGFTEFPLLIDLIEEK